MIRRRPCNEAAVFYIDKAQVMNREVLKDFNIYTEVNAESILDFVVQIQGVSTGFPFDNSIMVIKVGADSKHKIFALFNIDHFEWVNMKCDPEKSVDLRGSYDGVKPGWHMNKTHWNTVSPDPISDVPAKLFWELLLHSYELVKQSLPVKIKSQLS